ncbi:MAG: FAD-dependent oxidoreductase [Coriobacteriales bacterium]|jgi:2,4-dienoyl-CoA reductase-like NADH-dependent reductase (Old Yellow Enzyme family)/thioredoxin reductase
MAGDKYPKLNEPMRFGKNYYKNRIFASPQDYPGLTSNRFLTEEAAYFYERKAMGGFASVTVGDMMTDPDHGRTHPFQMRGMDLLAKVNLGRVATAIKRHGAVAAIELVHGGENVDPNMFPEGNPGYVLGPNDRIREDGVEVRAMNDEQIDALIQTYIDSASFAVQTGFNHIVLHGGHGWQIHQWLSPTYNHRKDKWGGSIENWMRFPLAVIEGIRKEVGRGIPIEFRLSAAELVPGGYDIDYALEIAKALDGKVDIIHVSVGHHENPDAGIYTHPTMFLPDGVNAHYARDIKKVVETPVATVGAHTSPDAMEELLENGTADIICLGRQSLADPDLPIKVMIGEGDDVTPCMRCFTCFNNSTVDGTFYCAVNPEIGREKDAIFTAPNRYSKKVLVIGGGPGGMQTALTAAKRGHKVKLVEKSNRLGGCLLCEEKVPFKQNLQRYLRVMARRCEKEPAIEVITNMEATPEWAKSQGADVIVTAMGSKPMVIPIPGIDKALCADDVYIDEKLAGKNVVIMGGGLVGLELGLYLSSLDRKVTVVEMMSSTCATPETPDEGTSKHMSGLMGIPAGYPLVQGDAIAYEMKTHYPDMEVKCNTRALEVTDEGLKVDEKGVGEHVIPADTVVYAVGQKPLQDESNAFKGCAREFYQIGDCVTAANVYVATSTGYQIALDLGRF